MFLFTLRANYQNGCAVTSVLCPCSHNALIRVYDEAGSVIETHEHTGEFKQP
jgi:hypothetical protein